MLRTSSQPTARTARRLIAITLAACAGAAAAPPSAGALTASAVRIGDHAGFVRVVVDFRGGRLPAPTEAIAATDALPFGDGRSQVRLARRGVRARARTVRAHGVTARVVQGEGRITVRLTTGRRRFKYLSRFTLRDPERLVVDLWKSSPPSPTAERRTAPDGCLALSSVVAGGGSVSVQGRERDLFEHSLVVRLRRANGTVVDRRVLAAARGRWRARLRYSALRPQAGTLEAVALSAQDGSLVCLVQVRVALGA